MHSHSDDLLLEDGHAQSKIRQGVTTEVLGEGRSAGPLKGQALGPDVQGPRQGRSRWSTLGGYFDAIDKAGVSVNVATYVGLDNVWECVMGESFDAAHAEAVRRDEGLARRGDEGRRARPVQPCSMMPPGSLATTDDLVELCKVVKKHGGIYSTHIRNEGTGVFDAVKEAIAVGERAGVPVDIIHLKIADQKLLGADE